MLKQTVFFIFIAIPFIVKAGKLEKGFEAIQILDYFKAKAYFEKSIEKEITGASYGLYKIYSAERSPFFNIDTAFTFLLMCDSSFLTISVKKRQYLFTFNISFD